MVSETVARKGGPVDCPACGHANRDGAKFCAQCAMPLPAACASCGSELGPRARFCDQCGTPLTYEGDSSPGEVHAYISTFDEPDAFLPKLHVFVPEGISWLHIADQLPRYRETARGGAEPIAIGDSST